MKVSEFSFLCNKNAGYRQGMYIEMAVNMKMDGSQLAKLKKGIPLMLLP